MRRVISRLRETLDYRFIVALIVLLLVGAAVWGFVERQRENIALAESARASASNIAILTDRVNLLTDQLDAQRREFAAASKHAAGQRRALRQQNRTLAAGLRSLLAYLTQHDIAVPDEVLKGLETSASGGGSGAPTTSGHPKRHRQHRPPAAATHPAPTGPGKSGTHPCTHATRPCS